MKSETLLNPDGLQRLAEGLGAGALPEMTELHLTEVHVGKWATLAPWRASIPTKLDIDFGKLRFESANDRGADSRWAVALNRFAV